MLEQIKAIMVEAINVDEALITPEATLQADLGIDSLTAIELAMELETAFGIGIEDEKLAELKTVQDILDIVEVHQA